MKRAIGLPAAIVLALVVVVVGLSGTYAVDEAEQAVVLQFGKPVGDPITTPGLKLKLPFIQDVRRFDKRMLVWDGDPNQIPTSGREFISVDTTARWRITDPLEFLQSVGNEASAQSRLDDIIDSVVRDEVSGTNLIEIVRSDDWEVTQDDLERMEVVAVEGGDKELMASVEVGRQKLTRRILAEAGRRTPQYGIELVDVRIKRLNYIQDVRRQVFDRMVSERQRIAEKYRSQGNGEASRIEGETSRQLAEIRSEAAREAEVVRGEADAEATRVYSAAYNADPEFYAFSRSLESYAESLGEGSVLVLGTDSAYFQYLRSLRPQAAEAEAAGMGSEASAQAARKSQVLQELRQIAMSMQTDQMMGSGWPSAEEARNGALQGMQDAWGEPYQYEPPEDSRGTPKLFSKGKDRQAGTDDDIVFENWQDLGG